MALRNTIFRLATLLVLTCLVLSKTFAKDVTSINDPQSYPICGLTSNDLIFVLQQFVAADRNSGLMKMVASHNSFTVDTGKLDTLSQGQITTWTFARKDATWALLAKTAWDWDKKPYYFPPIGGTNDLNRVNGKWTLPSSYFPIVGISTADVQAILKIIAIKEGDTSHILLIQVRKQSVSVQTGTVKGFLNGSGRTYYFEKRGGNWVLSEEMEWISQHRASPLQLARSQAS